MKGLLLCRFGTCGGVREEVTPGSVVVSGKGSVMVLRNPDAFFPDAAGEDCYRVSRVMPASPVLSKAVSGCSCYREVVLGG
jgi:uridine phosphorylase